MILYNTLIVFLAILIYLKVEDILARIIVSIYELSNQPGMILNWYGNITKKVFGDYWSKAFSQCPTCMVSVYWIAPIIAAAIHNSITIDLSYLWLIPLSIVSGLSLSYKTTILATRLNKLRNEAVLADIEIDKNTYE